MTGALVRLYPVLGVADFRLLWLATVPALFAFQFGIVVSGYAAVRLSDAAVVVGLVGGAWGVPLLFVPLVGGVAADRFSRRRIMLASQAALALTTVVVAVLAYSEALAIWHLVVLGLIQGTSFAFVTPSRVAYAADVVGPALMPSALATHHASLTLAGIIGPAIAGALLVVSVIGIGGTYAVMSGLYVLCVVGLARLPDRPGSAETDGGAALGRLVDGVRYVWSVPPLAGLIGVAATAALLGMPYIPLMPLYAERVFGVGSPGLGLLLAASGLGSFIGAVAAGAATGRSRLAPVLPILGLGFGLALVGLAGAPTFELAIAAAFAVGTAGAALAISNNSLLIGAADPRYFGRVWSINQLTFGLTPLGAVLLGALADALTLRAATAVGAAVLSAVVVTLAVRARRVLNAGPAAAAR